MQEWDGLKTTRDRVVVIGSTNRPYDLDEAVLRRLPRRVLVDLPDKASRRAILDVTLARNRLDASVDLDGVAAKLEGYSGSDCKEVCREAIVRISHELGIEVGEHIGRQARKRNKILTAGLRDIIRDVVQLKFR